jgi:cytochrome c peroxidase
MSRRSIMGFFTAGPAARTGLPLRRRWPWTVLSLLLVGGGAFTQASHSRDPSSRHPNVELSPYQEPITPVPPPPVADPLKLTLGERLFEDPRLSHDGKRTCSACHDVHTNGADGRRRDTAPDGSELSLNTSTVFNAALSFRLNWEGEFRTLEAQAEASLENPTIMGTGVDQVLGRLSADPGITRQFREAYGHAPDRAGLVGAIAIYERSLLTPGSQFDRWLDGDAAALSTKELEGYHVFKSLGCISCHQGVNVGGNLFERHGIFHPLASPTPEILRVPSLRNVATTRPYFHDGSAPTLDDAVRRMGAAQLNLALSDHEVETIVAFLGTLTGNYRGRSVRAAP